MTDRPPIAAHGGPPAALAHAGLARILRTTREQHTALTGLRLRLRLSEVDRPGTRPGTW